MLSSRIIYTYTVEVLWDWFRSVEVVELIDVPGVLSEACRSGLFPVISGFPSERIILTCPSAAVSLSKKLRDPDCACSIEVLKNQSGPRYTRL